VPEQGKRLITEIIKKSEKLAKHHDSGRVVPEFRMTFLRMIIYPPFRVVYRRDTHQISIIRVWRSERLPQLPPIENSNTEKLRAMKGKLSIEDNWEKLRSMEIQENRATYGKRKRLARESKKLNRKEEQALADEGLQKK
jgi:toxin ParE1/3/4